ncbi:MAG TPA: PEP/pyruvate-binding domain-containing protein [Polyangiales bacterium]|nr:PEP/pyruvate-binding domain-containing protein [Polyangiales bacterium]
MSALLRPIDAILPSVARNFGGKARNLAALARAGFPVPMAYALSCEAAEQAFARGLPPDLQPRTLLASAATSEGSLAEARERVLALELGTELEQTLRGALEELRAAGVEQLAVRSSSTAEDQHVASAAGLHTSILNVRSEAELFDAVRTCWASVCSPRLLSYLHALGLEGAASVGVLIQALVPASVSGVLFTINPLTSNTHELVINAAYGLGNLVADGRVSPDTYYIDKDTGFLRDRVVGDKELRAEPAPTGGVREVSVPSSIAQREALDQHALSRLTEMGRRIERHFGDARDVEWAFVEDALYILQARPIVLKGMLPARKRPRAKAKRATAPDRGTVWSNVNVGEALPGVATPLTWSILSSFSDFGFRRAFAALGCSVPRNSNLVGNFRGRIYLNLSELTRIAAQVPGLRPRSVLPLGGGLEIERLEREMPEVSRMGFLSRLPVTAARFARENLGLRGRIERFEPAFQEECARIRSLDLRILPSPALDETLSDVHRLLNETGGLMLTAYGGLLAALVPLSATLRMLKGDDGDKLQRDLLSALEDVESANPGREILRISEVITVEEATRKMIVGADRELSVRDLPHGPARQAIEAFLVRYGHRGIREAELSEPRWREDQTLLFDTIRLHLRGLPAQAADSVEKRGRALREEGERALMEFGFPARTAVLGLLAVVRNAMRLRERLRDNVVQVLDLFRLLACDASRRIAIREPGIGEDAAFFLTLSELHGYLRGELRTVRPLLQLRRSGYERDRSLPDPPDTFVDYPPPVAQLGRSASVLEGLAASSGQVQGRARVLTSTTDISAFEPGEILVVPAADVGWSPLFLAAAGLATDLGGPLSHACVVAREYGLPAVVNLRVATRAIKTGDRVLLDGDSGRLQVLGHD